MWLLAGVCLHPEDKLLLFKMPKCPKCEKEVYFGEISAFFTSSAAFQSALIVHFLVSWLENQTRTAETSVFYADMWNVFSAQTGETSKCTSCVLEHSRKYTNVHVCDATERVLN